MNKFVKNVVHSFTRIALGGQVVVARRDSCRLNLRSGSVKKDHFWDHGLQRGTPKAQKGLPSVITSVCVRVNMSVIKIQVTIFYPGT